MLKGFLDPLRRPQPLNLPVLIAFSAFLLVCLYISIWARYSQLEVWKSYESSFYSGNTPMMSTLDAYRFTRHAKEYAEGRYDANKTDPMIFYPDGSIFPDPPPLLSVILAFVSRVTGLGVYNAGANMIPFLSSLFIIPLALYFLFAGYPAAGILGGFVCSFAPMYYGRTAMGRLDTDGMNMFFLFAASLFVYLASKAKKPLLIYLYSALAGVVVFLFYQWYHHGMFNIFYLFVLAGALFLVKAKFKEIAFACAVFILCSNPLYMYNAFGQFYDALYIYVFHSREGLMAAFPNVYQTIGEARRASVMSSLSAVIANPYITLAGLGGALLFAAANFRAALPLAPIAALGFMTFISAGRFSMFLAPIAGVGLGYLTVLLLSYIKTSEKWKPVIRGGGTFAAAALIMFFITYTENNSFKMIPGPSINPRTYAIFEEMKKTLPQNAAIYTWWDYGLAIADVSGFPVFHSGISQQTPKTWLIAKSLTGNQETLYNIASYLDAFGVAEVGYMAEDNASSEEIYSRVARYGEGPMNDADYILLTQDMVSKIAPISFLAENGVRTSARIASILCKEKENRVFACGGNVLINVQKGEINGEKSVSHVVFTEKGSVKTAVSHNIFPGYYIVIDETPGVGTTAYIMDRRTYDTSFVQLYLLNSPQESLFTPVLDRYPYGRLFRINPKASSDGK